MPIYDENPRPPVAARVAPSAALELFWLTLRCDGGAAPGQDPRFARPYGPPPALARRTRAFWGVDEAGFPEVLVIAHRRGLLLGESLDEFLSDLPLSSLRTDDLTLASETAEVRAMIIRRLERLRADRTLRRRYLSLLRALWNALRSEWEIQGLAAVASGCGVARRRLESGEKPADLVPSLSPQALDLLRQPGPAAVIVCPGYLTGRCVWELPGVMLLGIPADRGSDLAELRARAEGLAQRLKALADPTRLAILLRVCTGPVSITDVTREFGISQPAVSVHFRVLRDANLVTGTRDGGRTLYNLDVQNAGDFLEELSHALAVAPATSPA